MATKKKTNANAKVHAPHWVAACERLSDELIGVAFHPACPPWARNELLGVACDIGNQLHDDKLDDERDKFDVRYAFTVLGKKVRQAS